MDDLRAAVQRLESKKTDETAVMREELEKAQNGQIAEMEQLKAQVEMLMKAMYELQEKQR